MVFDASALLAALLDEPGGDLVLAQREGGVVSAANLLEVLAHRSLAEADAWQGMAELGLSILPVEEGHVRLAAGLLRRHRGVLSLADCLCIATAQLRLLPILTADRIWATLPLGIDARLIRP